jgi:NADP-dependent 3-hydroxy acid dehydrogenase YdfG
LRWNGRQITASAVQGLAATCGKCQAFGRAIAVALVENGAHMISISRGAKLLAAGQNGKLVDLKSQFER